MQKQPATRAMTMSAMQSMFAQFAQTNQQPTEAEHLQSKQEIRGMIGKFSEYCLTTLQQCDPQDEQSLGLILISAVHLNDIGTIQCLLDAHDQSFERFGPTAAMVAAGSGYFEIVRLLFQHNPLWFDSAPFIRSGLCFPFEIAAMNQHRNIVEFLLPHTSVALINSPSRKSILGTIEPLLINLVKCNCFEILSLILTCKPNLEIRSSENNTPLSEACMGCQYDIVEALIKAGADVNVSANINKDQDSIAQPNAIDKIISALHGNKGINITPLQFAAGNGHAQLVYLLLKSGARVNVPSSLLGSALFLAAGAKYLDPDLKHFRRDYPNVVRLLLMYKAEVDERHSDSGETALFTACLSSQVDIANQLLLAGANPSAGSKFRKDLQASSLLESMGIKLQTPSSSNTKIAAIQSRAYKTLQIQAQGQEDQIRKELEASLSSGKYRSTLAIEPAPLKVEPAPAAKAEESKASKKKKKKKKQKSKQIPFNSSPQKNSVDGESGDQAIAPPDGEDTKTGLSETNRSASPKPLTTNIEEKSNVVLPNIQPLEEKSETCVAITSNMTHSTPPAPTNNSPLSKPEKSAPLIKSGFFNKRDAITLSIPPSPFGSDIPTGNTLRKFPLRLAGVRLIHYYVVLIPDELNKQFDSSHLIQLKKMWAAILSERLLPPKSKDKLGVKCLSGNEMLQLKVGLFKTATHKVKHPSEDTRTYLQSKLPKDGKTEIHLELLGTNFHAHKKK